MFKTVLYPTDFSDVSKKALDYIKKLAQSGTEKVVVLHVIDQGTIRIIDRIGPHDAVTLKQDLLEDARNNLLKIEAELTETDLVVETRQEMGVPVREILRAESESDISLLVIGSHGKSNLEEIFMGSVSEKVTRKCKKPVLIIKR